jgi:hypothetical protein
VSGRLKSLKGAVRVLASDATAQLEHLGRLGLSVGIDELALEYDDIAAAADDMLRCREIDENQYDWVKKLHKQLSEMSGQANSRLWTVEALSSAPEWKEVRHLAKECLRLIERQ